MAPIVVAGAAVVAAVVGAVGTISAAKSQSDAEKYNQQVDANNALQASQAADAQAAVTEQQTRTKLGQEAAAYGASGVDVDTGTPVDVLSNTASQGKLDALTVRYGGRVVAGRDTASGNLASFSASNDASAGYVNAGSTLLTGVGSAARSYGKLGGGGW